MKIRLSYMMSCLAVSLFCDAAYAQIPAGSESPVILDEIRVSLRKPFIYNIGVLAGYTPSHSGYTSVNTTLDLACDSFRVGGYFEWQASRIRKGKLNVGLELGYCHGVYTVTDRLMQKDFNTFIGNVRVSPYLSYDIRPFRFIVGIDGRIPSGFSKEKESIALVGINRDCLRDFAPGIYGAFGLDFRVLQFLVGLGYEFGTGIFDLDRLAYYKRSSFQYSQKDNFMSFFLVRVPVFGNGR